jgi:hypothetical protein
MACPHNGKAPLPESVYNIYPILYTIYTYVNIKMIPNYLILSV